MENILAKLFSKDLEDEYADLLSETKVVLADSQYVKLSLRQRRKEKKISKYVLGYDKRYRGPLSLFALRVFAWICIVLTQVAVIMKIAADPLGMPNLTSLSQIVEIFASLSMPLFLLANFAYIIQNKADMWKLLLTYFFMMMIVAGVFYLIFLHYGVGLFSKLFSLDYEIAYDTLGILIMGLFNSTFKFNMFVDLFICTLIVYFALSRPKKHFKGKKIIIFRLFTIIPIGYELLTIVLKILAANAILGVPFLMTPFMPTKCPMTFVAFMLIVLDEAKRKRKYVKYNKGSDENYEEYFKTKKNSWLFAKSTSKNFAIAGLIDLILAVAFYMLALSPLGIEIISAQSIIDTLELGESIGLLLFAPFVFLFSYNKMFKPSKLDLFLPILAIIAIVLLWTEAGYQAILNLV